MLMHKPVNRYLASKDAKSSGAAAPDGASPRRLRTPPRSVTSTIRLSCRLFVDVTTQCAASVCSRTIEKYQYGCTFYEKKYSHTGILSSQKFCHSWNVLRDNYFWSDAAMKSNSLVLFFLSKFGTISSAATLSSRKEVFQLENVIAFIISLVASVVSYYLCKWLDRDDT